MNRQKLWTANPSTGIICDVCSLGESKKRKRTQSGVVMILAVLEHDYSTHLKERYCDVCFENGFTKAAFAPLGPDRSDIVIMYTKRSQ